MHVAADAGVERPKGLVEKQDARLLQERLRDREALLHAAGELRGIAVARRAEPDLRQRLLNLVAQRSAGAPVDPAKEPRALDLQRQDEVLRHGEMREDGIALEHDPTIRRRLGRKRRVGNFYAAGCGPLLAEQHPQERGLAAARGAHDGDE